MSETNRYILLPSFGFTGQNLSSDKLRAAQGVVRLDARPALRHGLAQGAVAANDVDAATSMTILDSIGPDGPKLVEMTAAAELNLRAEIPGLKIVPIVYYRQMRAEQEVQRAALSADEAAEAASVTVTVTDAASGAGLAGAKVLAFTNFRTRAGAEATTGRGGKAALPIGRGATLDRLYVYGPPGYWGHVSRGRSAEAEIAVAIRPIDLADRSLLLRQIYGDPAPETGAGVTVGVIDSGVDGGHPCLPNVGGGANLVLEETSVDPAAIDNWGPAVRNGEHGTHVAGIVGARPAAGLDFRGVAPGVTLRSYRVFPNTGGGATNYDIMNAIDRAVADGCHVINLSLGGGPIDEGVRAAIGQAADKGRLVVAAAGNDGRRPVSFPASLDICVAVSAMGRRSAFPPESSEAADIAKPYGLNEDAFVAAFSNYGPQIDLTGPGVGVVSTLPDGGFGVMSGTSMAAPAVAGFAARLWSADRTIRDAPEAGRVAVWKAALSGLGVPQGFGRDYEGAGLPLDTGVV